MTVTNPIHPTLTAEQIAHFWNKVARAGDDECWLWTGSLARDGYGKIVIDYRQYRAHVLARYLSTGTWPAPLFTCHACDHPLCCNPAHLFLGTQADNVADRTRKGRSASGDRHGSKLHPESVRRGDQHHFRLHPELCPTGSRNGAYTHPEQVLRGECNGMAKLQEEDVREIRRLRAAGWLLRPLALRFKVSEALVSRIALRKSWAHVQ